MQKLGVVALEIAADAHHNRFIAVPKMPPALLAALQIERETVMALEVSQRTRDAVPLEIRRRRANNAAVCCELDCDEARIDRATDAYAQVESEAQQIDHLIGEPERNAHLRILRDERGAVWRDVRASESCRGGNDQMPCRLLPAFDELCLDLF